MKVEQQIQHERRRDAPPVSDGQGGEHPGLSPLPGEPGIPDVAARRREPMSGKGLLVVGLLAASVVIVLALSIQRVAASGRSSGEIASPTSRSRPAAASQEPHKLDMTAAAASAASPRASEPLIPALEPLPDEIVDPIGIRRKAGANASTSATPPAPKAPLPQDAPVLLFSNRVATNTVRPTEYGNSPGSATEAEVTSGDSSPKDQTASTARALAEYQRRLQGTLDNLTKVAALASPAPIAPDSPTRQAPPGIANALAPSAGRPSMQSPVYGRAMASMLGNRSLTLPKGTAFTCALSTKVVSATAGLIGCVVQRNLYGDDGRVLLVERGSHLDGEYHVTAVKPGTVRIPVVWTRIRTPLGVTVELESPGTGQLGESGIDGYVDNRWSERIGAAMLLSLIDDSVKLVIQNQANDRQTDTIVMPSTTANTSKLAEKVLDSTINIPPLIYQNQGGIVGIYVARDLDFSSVYELQPSPAGLPPGASP